MSDEPTERDVEEPIEVGWYADSGGAQTMIFHLRSPGQWSVHLDNGTASDCAWGYIEQALGVWDLVRLTADAERIAQARREGAAEALDEAADAWERTWWDSRPRRFQDWLRHRSGIVANLVDDA